MLKRNKAPRRESDPLNVLSQIPPVGETIKLSNGVVLQKPNAQIIAALQAIDPRVRYFPTDLAKAEATTKAGAYYRGVTDLLPTQILEDFPGDRRRTAQRGTVISLRDEFPYFKDRVGWEAPEPGQYLIKPIYAEQLLPMNNILTVLRTGSDRGGEIGNLGAINQSGRLNSHTEDWLMYHTEGAIEALAAQNEWEKANNLFPGVLVYESSRISFDASGTIIDPSALVAVYVTDRQIHDALKLQPAADTLQRLGGAALRA